jgi:hypothetical protein
MGYAMLKQRVSPHKLGSLFITTYDFRTAMKRVGRNVHSKKVSR